MRVGLDRFRRSKHERQPRHFLFLSRPTASGEVSVVSYTTAKAAYLACSVLPNYC